jgi:hypothetical protein
MVNILNSGGFQQQVHTTIKVVQLFIHIPARATILLNYHFFVTEGRTGKKSQISKLETYKIGLL